MVLRARWSVSFAMSCLLPVPTQSPFSELHRRAETDHCCFTPMHLYYRVASTVTALDDSDTECYSNRGSALSLEHLDNLALQESRTSLWPID